MKYYVVRVYDDECRFIGKLHIKAKTPKYAFTIAENLFIGNYGALELQEVED